MPVLRLVNVAMNWTSAPGGTVMGVVTGCGVPNGAPGARNPVIVIGRVPVFVTSTEADERCPTATRPKATLPGAALSTPAPAIPNPDSETDAAVPPRRELGSLNELLWLAVPAGAYVTLSVTDWPAGIRVP